MILRNLAHNILSISKKRSDNSSSVCKYLCIKLRDTLTNENLLFLQGKEPRSITKIINNFFLLVVSFLCLNLSCYFQIRQK